jgi:Rieske [2Fe-2S] domain
VCGDDSSSHATTVDVSGLHPGEVLPVDVTLPDADQSKARVFVVHPTGRLVMALLGISTHLGCRLLFRGDQRFGEGFTGLDQFVFEDPCGGSTFTLDGRCVGGPCPRDLDRYEVKLVDHTGRSIFATWCGDRCEVRRRTRRSGYDFRCCRIIFACAFIPAPFGWNMKAGDAGTCPSTQRRLGVAQAS